MMQYVIKSSLLKMALLVFSIMLTLSSCDDKETMVPETELPAIARTYIDSHFPEVSISQVWKDKGDGRSYYEVTLVNGAYLEFDKSGNISQIEYYGGLPNSTIQKGINDYVAANFKGQKIVEWELENNREQSVTLINRLELIFDMAGNFKRIDQ